MFKYNNTHIFTGYLKQLLASVNLPTCKIYTQEFAEYLKQYGSEDPRVLESFDTIAQDNGNKRLAVRVNYLKNNEPYVYFSKYPQIQQSVGGSLSRVDSKFDWKLSAKVFYDINKPIFGLTKALNSPGNYYDTVTHEYLGEYLRFLRDYYNINLMSLYNCFNNKIRNNILYKHKIKVLNPQAESKNNKYTETYREFNSQDSSYKIYAVPVKLFADYTIAIDCDQGIEMFCGFYGTTLDMPAKSEKLAAKTYTKINKTTFSQPFLYDKLNVKYWPVEDDYDFNIKGIGNEVSGRTYTPRLSTGLTTDTYTRWEIANKERDLKLIIKVPTSCNSSIVILEGDYRSYNDTIFSPGLDGKMIYKNNHSVVNFGNKFDSFDRNAYGFKPISKLQLLAFNNGESYPFADRLVEYLSGSAITPIDEIADNIKRTQYVMMQNNNYFAIEGLWENKMQKLLYDSVMASGPIVVEVQHNAEGAKIGNRLVDKRTGLHPRLGKTSKSSLYDVLGYVDKDAEKLYASWKIVGGQDTGKDSAYKKGSAAVKDSIQNVDIYNDLYDI